MIKGIVRNLDRLGRVTLPVEMRRSLGMVAEEEVDMWLNGGVICVQLLNKKDLHGIVRAIDNLGRIVPPREYLKSLKINTGDPVDMYLNGEVICIKKVTLQCVCCGNTEEDKLIEYNGVHMCPACIKQMWGRVVNG